MALIADLVIVGFDKVEIRDTIRFVVGAAMFSLLAVNKKLWFHITVLGGWAAYFIVSMVN
jgi:hypothetical protein